MDGSKEPRIRFTCNACQEAKVRCSRDKPSCRRCLKQSRRCIYSYAQRLGRPRRNTGLGGAEKSPAGDDNMYGGFTVPGSSSIAEPFPVQDPGPAQNHEHRAPATTADRELESEIQYPDPLDLDFSNDNDATSVIFQDNCHDAMDDHAISNFQSDQLFHIPHGPADDRQPSHQPSPKTSLDDFVNSFPLLDSHGASHSDSDYSLLDASDPSFVRASASMNTAPPHRLERRPTKTRASNFDFGPCPSQVSRTLNSSSENDFLHSASIPGRKDASSSSSLDAFNSALDSHTSESTSDSKLGSRGDGGAVERGCKCYRSVLRRLSDLHENYSGNINTTIDQVMRAEKDVRNQVSEALECRRCSNNSSLLLLLSVLLQHVTELLEGISFGDVYMSGIEQDGDVLGSGGSIKGTGIDVTALRLGNYEIDGEEKADFLKLLLNQRLQRLAATTRKLHNWMQRDTGRESTAFNRKIGTILMAEIYQRLMIIIRRLEG